MVALIEDKRDAIEKLCRGFGVVRLYLFGSATREDFRPGESDIERTKRELYATLLC